jgi:hypothetical protein
VEFAPGYEDAIYLAEDLRSAFMVKIHEGEEGGDCVEGVVKELKIGRIHY